MFFYFQCLVRLQVLPLERNTLTSARPTPSEHLEDNFVPAREGILQLLDPIQSDNRLVPLSGPGHSQMVGRAFGNIDVLLLDGDLKDRPEKDVAAIDCVKAVFGGHSVEKGFQVSGHDICNPEFTDSLEEIFEKVLHLGRRHGIPARFPQGDELAFAEAPEC